MRGDDFQQIECREAVFPNPVPEPIVAAGPDQPHVASLDLRGKHGRRIVHVAKIIFLGLRKTCHVAIGLLRFVRRTGGLGLGVAPRSRGGYRQDADVENAIRRGKMLFRMTVSSLKSVGSSGRRNCRSIRVQFKCSISRRLVPHFYLCAVRRCATILKRTSWLLNNNPSSCRRRAACRWNTKLHTRNALRLKVY